ncbi:MAG: 6-bladed beta-propeller [Acidobacteriota bacterium]|nr:6-bladed beta-propeller [Acidobacteriota bacterium]
MFFALVFLITNTGWEIDQTGIYSELNPYRVIVTADDHAFLTDFRKGSIAHYHHGVFVNKIGRKGEGPGEFGMIWSLHYDTTTRLLYVSQTFRNHIIFAFSHEGKLTETIDVPEGFRLKFRKKIVGRWVQAVSTSDGFEHLVVTDHYFKNEQTLYTSERPGAGPKDRGMVQISQSTDFIYFKPRGESRLLIYKANDLSLHHTALLELPRIPIPEGWSEGTAISRAEKKTGMKLQKKTSEYFPLVKALSPGRGDHILVYSGSHFLKPDLEPLQFDSEGRKVKNSFSALALKRLMAVHGNWAYVSTFKGEEAGLVKVEADQVNDLVKSAQH